MTETTEQKRIIGKITGVIKDRGFGFIASPDIQFERIFFHWTALTHDTKKFLELDKGMKVEFTPIDYVNQKTGKKQGFRALKIVVLE